MRIEELPGIIPSKAKQFNNKGIETVEDLLNFLPRKYNDFTRITGILPPDQVSTVVIHLEELKAYYKQTTVIKAIGYEINTRIPVQISWFNQAWMRKTVSGCIGKDVFVAGKFEYNFEYRVYEVGNPLKFDANISGSLGVYPIYSKIQGMTDDYITETFKKALATPAACREICPDDIVKRENQISMQEAYRCIYLPKNLDDVRKGQERILFNDLLYFALHNEVTERETSRGTTFNIKTLYLYNQILEALPYKLTADQEKAVQEICRIGKSGLRINGLVQGDVGCGKTLVAQLAIAAFVGSGYQAALMAPTQVLAEQHYEDTRKLLEPYGVQVVYIGGKMTAAEKRKKYADIASGAAQVIIGTTSILNKDIAYKCLALTIADEEQRFGVSQRAALIAKAKDGVHSITMSATPIPRSLAMVMYGDTVQLFTIKTMPPGRTPVKTGIGYDRAKIYRYLLRLKAKGQQAYVVCPKIKGSEKDIKSVEQLYTEYTQALSPYGFRIETLTGRNSAAETEEIINRFKSGETDILISTTVVEVGVNVPNATLMVISNAERFGLSSLHQLRGRVGRGSLESYCVLESSIRDGIGKQRLDAMCETTSGFEIAKKDLEIRGAGDFIGTQQSGKDNKYIALMLTYADKYEKAKSIAAEILDRGYSCCDLATTVMQEKELVPA